MGGGGGGEGGGGQKAEEGEWRKKGSGENGRIFCSSFLSVGDDNLCFCLFLTCLFVVVGGGGRGGGGG